MNRYQGIGSRKDKDGKVLMKTVLYPDIPRSSDDLWVQTDSGDRLDLLAHQYYGNVQYWWIIAQANGVGKGTLYIEPGTQLRIPANAAGLEEQQRKLNQG